MSIPSVYINLEDDVSKIITRLKHNSAKQIILVCPKRCFLFNDSINLRLLKKQTDLLLKEIFILTMDERGQLYAKEAGFSLKFLPKTRGSEAMSDVKVQKKSFPSQSLFENSAEDGKLINAVKEIKHIAKKFVPASIMKGLPGRESESQSEPVVKVKKASSIPKVKITDAFFPPETKEAYIENGKSYSQKIITGSVAVSLVVILVLVFVILPKASVVVYAKAEPVTRDMEINMSLNISSIDAGKLVMPATKVDETVNLGDKFQSQGKKQVGNKASGTIKIYNFTKLPLNLKVSTTVLTAGSKTYNLLADVMALKPTVYKNAKTKEIDTASLGDSIEIIATAGGEDYNLPSGTRVEITNQVFGSKPLALYAKTDSEITGGTTRYLSVISQDDVTLAKNQLQQQALERIKEKLKGSKLALPDKTYNFEVSQFTTDNPVGAETPSFQASLQAKLSGLAFKSDDLKNLIFERIKQTLDTNKTLEAKEPDSTTVKVKDYNPTNQLAILVVHFQGRAIFDLNLPDISGELVGKSQADANEILRSKAEIDKVEITLAPSWQKNFPLFASKIKINIARNGTNN